MGGGGGGGGGWRQGRGGREKSTNRSKGARRGAVQGQRFSFSNADIDTASVCPPVAVVALDHETPLRLAASDV